MKPSSRLVSASIKCGLRNSTSSRTLGDGSRRAASEAWVLGFLLVSFHHVCDVPQAARTEHLRSRLRSFLPHAALGAAAAFDGRNGRPHKIVVDVDGDGSFLMNCQVRRMLHGMCHERGACPAAGIEYSFLYCDSQELATAYVENLDLKCFILNNQYLGMVMQWEDRFYKSNRAHTYLGKRVSVACMLSVILPALWDDDSSCSFPPVCIPGE